jgi:hypothetical protein
MVHVLFDALPTSRFILNDMHVVNQRKEGWLDLLHQQLQEC